MQLYQPLDGYRYNSDSIFLYGFISQFEPRGRMLDVGAGSGVLGLLVARDFPRVNLEAVELQKEFVHYASKNAKVNKIAYHIHHTDLRDFTSEEPYDYIVSNPPFYHEGASRSEHDMIATARSNTSLPLDEFFFKVSKLLKPKGHFIFCYDPQQFGLICAALDKVNMRVVDAQFVHPKADRPASLVMLHVRKNSKSLMKTWSPFFAFDGEMFSPEAQHLYKKAKTHSIKCHI
ncbi:MAG: methyltransferase [Campylobacterota bacterium]|nr:methyltransferase [Campylobacterota bacterium]